MAHNKEKFSHALVLWIEDTPQTTSIISTKNLRHYSRKRETRAKRTQSNVSSWSIVTVVDESDDVQFLEDLKKAEDEKIRHLTEKSSMSGKKSSFSEVIADDNKNLKTEDSAKSGLKMLWEQTFDNKGIFSDAEESEPDSRSKSPLPTEVHHSVHREVQTHPEILPAKNLDTGCVVCRNDDSDMSMEERVLHILNYTVVRVKSIIKGKSNCQEKKIEGNLRSDEHRHQVKLKKLEALKNSSPIKITEKSTNADYSDRDQVIHNASTKSKYQNNDLMLVSSQSDNFSQSTPIEELNLDNGEFNKSSSMRSQVKDEKMPPSMNISPARGSMSQNGNDQVDFKNGANDQIVLSAKYPKIVISNSDLHIIKNNWKRNPAVLIRGLISKLIGEDNLKNFVAKKGSKTSGLKPILTDVFESVKYYTTKYCVHKNVIPPSTNTFTRIITQQCTRSRENENTHNQKKQKKPTRTDPSKSTSSSDEDERYHRSRSRYQKKSWDSKSRSRSRSRSRSVHEKFKKSPKLSRLFRRSRSRDKNRDHDYYSRGYY